MILVQILVALKASAIIGVCEIYLFLMYQVRLNIVSVIQSNLGRLYFK